MRDGLSSVAIAASDALRTLERTLRVFVSYSKKDKRFLERLQTHLKYWEVLGHIVLWDSTRIKSGSTWRWEIEQALTSAKVAVLLVSADFLASDFIVNHELLPLLARAETNGTIILTVFASACILPKELEQYQCVNAPDKPLNQMKPGDREEVFTQLTNRIRLISEDYLYS
jgi:TIR domain